MYDKYYNATEKVRAAAPPIAGREFSNKRTVSDSEPIFDDGIRSNNWVIHGNHTSTGYPLLAADPHLKTTIPAQGTMMELIWEG